MKCSEIIEVLEALAPQRYACDWDNPGLLAGRREKEVYTIYIALDATDEAVEDAARQKADLLLTHHPLIFKAVKQVNDGNFITRRIVRLIQEDISYYAMHTNFDAAPGCMADLVSQRLGMTQCAPLEVLGEEDGVLYGIGKTGVLAMPGTVQGLAESVKALFGLPYVLVYGFGAPGNRITRVAVCPGSGGGEIALAQAYGAQVYITGDISHHQGIDAASNQMAVIDAGHYGLEHIFVPFMARYLRDKLPDQIRIVEEPLCWPAVIL